MSRPTVVVAAVSLLTLAAHSAAVEIGTAPGLISDPAICQTVATSSSPA